MLRGGNSHRSCNSAFREYLQNSQLSLQHSGSVWSSTLTPATTTLTPRTPLFLQFSAPTPLDRPSHATTQAPGRNLKQAGYLVTNTLGQLVRFNSDALHRHGPWDALNYSPGTGPAGGVRSVPILFTFFC